MEKYKKEEYVNYLVKITCDIIDNIWILKKENDKLMTLKEFIKYILMNLQITKNTLIICLIYLFRIDPNILRTNEKEKCILCGRRMFVISLIFSNEYLKYEDKDFSTISGLNNDEINMYKINFLKIINYNLNISEQYFNSFNKIVYESYKKYNKEKFLESIKYINIIS